MSNEANNKVVLLTKKGYEDFESELERLKSVERAEVAQRIKNASSYGDLSENAEYDAAKNEQAEMEERISYLENMLKIAEIIDEKDIQKDIVTVGAKVKISMQEPDDDTAEEMEFSVVGSAEADPTQGKISNESPIGNALLGNKVGKVIEVQVPDGVMKVEILSVNQ